MSRPDPEWDAIEARLRAAFAPPPDPARAARRHWRGDDARSARWSLVGVAAAAALVLATTLGQRPVRADLDQVFARFAAGVQLCAPSSTVPVVNCAVAGAPRTFGDFPLGATHDARFAIEGPLEGLPWSRARAVRVSGPEGVAFVLTGVPSDVVARGVDHPGLVLEAAVVDGHPVVELRPEGTSSCLEVFVAREPAGQPLLPEELFGQPAPGGS